MSNQVLVPSLGESVTEATVSKWLKQVGEEVNSDEPLVELETDKVNVEVPSPLSGILQAINVKEGDTVEVGALLGIVKKEKSASSEKKVEENSQQKEYEPPKAVKRKVAGRKNNEINLKQQETLKLVDTIEKDDKKEAPLVLDTLEDNEINDSLVSLERAKKQDYVPPKTKQNLSPAV